MSEKSSNFYNLQLQNHPPAVKPGGDFAYIYIFNLKESG